MKTVQLLIVIFLSLFLFPQNSRTQSIPTVAEVKGFIEGNNFLITYREGEAVYGTYYFIEVHYCSTGKYGLYGKSIKQTVMGNEQHSNWQEFGNWQVIDYNGSVGIHYRTTTALEKFFPVYKLANGDLSIGQGISIVKQGKAVCN